MTDRTRELKIAIYRNEPKLEWSLHDVDTGSLFQQLSLPPYQLIEDVERRQGSIRLEAQRTREWELLLGIALAESPDVAPGVWQPEIRDRLEQV